MTPHPSAWGRGLAGCRADDALLTIIRCAPRTVSSVLLVRQTLTRGPTDGQVRKGVIPSTCTFILISQGVGFGYHPPSMALLTSVYASNYALYAAAASQRGTSGHHPGFLPMGAMHFPFLSSEYGIPLPPYPLTTGMAAAARMDSASPDSIPTNLKITTTTTATSSLPSSSSSSPTTPSKNSENSRKNSSTSNRSDTSPKLSFSIEGILGRPDPRCPRLSLSSPGRTLDSHLVGVVDTQNPYLGPVGDPDSPRSDTYEDADGSGRFSWLQCTRYKPPKLPRKFTNFFYHLHIDMDIFNWFKYIFIVCSIAFIMFSSLSSSHRFLNWFSICWWLISY